MNTPSILLPTALAGASRSIAGVLALVLALTAEAKLNVVVTTPDLGSIAREVAGTAADITVLARPTEDPHFVEPKPSYIVKLNRADALVEGGAELEVGWLPPLIAQTRNSKIAEGAPGRIKCNEGVQMLEVPGTLDRSAGDIHPFGNPHFVIDPENARIVALHIADGLAKVDATNTALYQANAKKFSAQVEAKLVGWKKRLAPYQGRRLVAYHNSWPYFARRFEVVIDLFLEPKPGIQPSPAHLADVIAKMRAQQARVILVDPYLQRKTAETVAAATGATVVDVTQYPGGVKGTEGGYVAMMDHVVVAVAKALAAGTDASGKEAK